MDALASALATDDGPTIVALQAGNVHSGAFDDFAAAIPLAHEHGAWVHIDGAFGLWAAASPRTRHLVAGLELADSWATDAHKTLNVPYDSGLAFVADSTAHRAAMGIHAPYLLHSKGAPEPLELGPEFSQRARAFVLWATLQYLGRDGVAGLVDRMVGHAAAFADGVRAIGGEVLNDVVFTQVCTAWGDDRTTEEVERLLLRGRGRLDDRLDLAGPQGPAHRGQQPGHHGRGRRTISEGSRGGLHASSRSLTAPR